MYLGPRSGLFPFDSPTKEPTFFPLTLIYLQLLGTHFCSRNVSEKM
jgi:hypothetical protein